MGLLCLVVIGVIGGACWAWLCLVCLVLLGVVGGALCDWW